MSLNSYPTPEVTVTTSQLTTSRASFVVRANNIFDKYPEMKIEIGVHLNNKLEPRDDTHAMLENIAREWAKSLADILKALSPYVIKDVPLKSRKGSDYHSPIRSMFPDIALGVHCPSGKIIPSEGVSPRPGWGIVNIDLREITLKCDFSTMLVYVNGKEMALFLALGMNIESHITRMLVALQWIEA